MKFCKGIIILFISNQLFSQQQVSDLVIPFNVTLDDTAYHQLVELGLDSTATDDLDFHLGEYDLPPIPPPGYVCFLILPYNNFNEGIVSFKDFRFGELPYTGVIEYRLRIMYNDGATISWNLPTGATGLMQDLFGGIIYNFPINGAGSVYIANLGLVVGRFRIIITYDNVVPVEMVSLIASILQNEKAIQLNWTTATETNNSGFEVERLQDYKIEKLQEWETIGFVPGFGTITEPKSYSFIDENISTGIYKYRLKQIDFDGSFEYSNEIEVEVDFTPKEFVLYQNYPNPFNPNTIIKYEIQNVETTRRVVFTTLKVYDILGNEVATLVNEEKQPGVYEVEFNSQVSHSGEVRNLTSGVYFYQLQAGDFVQTMKIILTK
jgi:hypothetical protein